MKRRSYMAKFSNQRQPSERTVYEQKYKLSRTNLLLVVLCTAINLLFLVTNLTDQYYLFSATIPYFIASLGMYLCGRFPEEYYAGELEGMFFLDNSVFVVLLVISIVLTLLYLLAWFMSRKNRVGWLIFSLVFFGFDTLGMLFIYGFSFEMLFDILFHVWVIYELILGIRAYCKLKNLPPEEENEQNAESFIAEEQNSPIIRKADKDVKHKVLLETSKFGYDICYRRVKHTNELVINGNVYDEIQGIMEPVHQLEAWIDGHYIVASYTGSHSVISVDGENTAKKLRLV